MVAHCDVNGRLTCPAAYGYLFVLFKSKVILAYTLKMARILDTLIFILQRDDSAQAIRPES
jgi:hypothetical protein